ncbi:hypothetical protein [Microbacterium karelineae]|uniref:hypothetical protein n=1 Tax=Microbacterium karelineae TaxID=2654283 RepID=UPI0018D4607D|nr:hypothetical protein [Microbacterium karelineae]
MGRVERAARRAAASGSGPTHDAPARNPGAMGAFALFGEALLVGILVAVAGVFVVTLPAALVAGIRHLRRYVHGDGSPLEAFWRDLVRALPTGLLVGVAVAILAGALALDIALAGSGALPGGSAISAAGWVVAGLAGGALLLACGAWDPAAGWSGAVRAIPGAVSADPVGAIYHVIAAAFVGLAAWMLIPLAVPALGCAALAAVAIPARARRRNG